jgi:Ca2+-binding RTX toxin-like protein
MVLLKGARHLRQESEAMAVGPASERIVVRPLVEEENGRWPELERERRRQRRARTDSRRARQGAAFDGLAIGAPLTAAFVGMLLADGYAATDPAASQDGVAAARGGAPGISADSLAAGSAGAGSPAQDGETAGGTGGPDASAGAFQPSPSGAHMAGGKGEAAAPAGLAVPDEASAGAGAKAAVLAGPELSITFAGFGSMDAGLADEGAAGTGSGHSIGKFVIGGDGDDVIIGTEYDDHLYGGAGNDVIYGLGGDDLLDGGVGDDRLYGGAGDDRLYGGPGHDQLYGEQGDDLLHGGSGNDQLFGNEGRDALFGGIGDDYLDGGSGADRMEGGAGNDAFLVDDIHDVALERGANGGGLDTLLMGEGFAAGLGSEFGADAATFVLHDQLDAALPGGVAGYRQQLDPDIENVTLTGSAGHDVIGSDGANTITGNDGDNALFGAGGDDTLSGGAGNDSLSGGSGGDQLHGNDGNDMISGASGDDGLYGGAGDDWLSGGLGADRLHGQAGDDTFQLGLNDSGVDTIFDHEGVNGVTIENGQGHLVETAVAGDDLYVVVDKGQIAVVEGYLGNEGALAGIDAGSGSTSISDLMAENAGNGPAVSAPGSHDPAPSPSWAGDDVLGEFLTRPSLIGAGGRDTMSGTSGSDWLSGLGGDDHLRGGAGDDVLQGGAGNDVLEGGAGADRYLLRSGEAGLDSIRDVEGSNMVELHGFTGAKLEGVVSGQDLWILADKALLFTVEGFVGNEASFAGIHNGETFVVTDDLLA